MRIYFRRVPDLGSLLLLEALRLNGVLSRESPALTLFRGSVRRLSSLFASSKVSLSNHQRLLFSDTTDFLNGHAQIRRCTCPGRGTMGRFTGSAFRAGP